MVAYFLYVVDDLPSTMKLTQIINNQEEQMILLRRIAGAVKGPVAEDLKDLIPSPCKTTEDLEDFCEKLSEDSFRTKVVGYLC